MIEYDLYQLNATATDGGKQPRQQGGKRMSKWVEIVDRNFTPDDDAYCHALHGRMAASCGVT
jgi:hypothetical protein